MKPHESPRINKKSIRGDSGDSWPVWNRGIRNTGWIPFPHFNSQNIKNKRQNFGPGRPLTELSGSAHVNCNECGKMRHWK